MPDVYQIIIAILAGWITFLSAAFGYLLSRVNDLDARSRDAAEQRNAPVAGRALTYEDIARRTDDRACPACGCDIWQDIDSNFKHCAQCGHGHPDNPF